MRKGTYPTMNMTDIMADLSEWGISVSKEQLKKPTSEMVESIYYACLQHITDITFDSLDNPVRRIIENSQVEEKEGFVTPLTHTLLMYHLSRFAEAARIENFSSLDIAAPTAARTINILSGFLNFMKFTEQHCNSTILMLKERSMKLIAERDAVVAELHDIQQRIETIRAKIAEDEPRCDDLRQQNMGLRARMIATREQQQQSLEGVETLKAERSELTRRKESLNDEISNMSDLILRTKARVVQSPDRIRSNIQRMSAELVEERKVVASLEGKARDIQGKVNAMSAIEKDIRNCTDQLQTIEKESRLLEDSKKELADLKDQFTSKIIDREEFASTRERHEKQLEMARDKLKRAQKLTEEKKEASLRTLERLKKEYEEMSIDRRENDQQVEALRSEADAIEDKMKKHIKTSEAELNELLAEYWKLRHETDVYMETLANKLSIRISST